MPRQHAAGPGFVPRASENLRGNSWPILIEELPRGEPVGSRPTAMETWKIQTILAALFAGLTSVLAKFGMKNLAVVGVGAVALRSAAAGAGGRGT